MTLSGRTICERFRPLALYYSPVTKELLLVLALTLLPLLGRAALFVCWCINQIVYSSIALGENYRAATYRKSVKRDGWLSSFPTLLMSTCTGCSETSNVIMCVPTMKSHLYEQELTGNWGRSQMCDGNRCQILFSSQSWAITCLFVFWLKPRSKLRVNEFWKTEGMENNGEKLCWNSPD